MVKSIRKKIGTARMISNLYMQKKAWIRIVEAVIAVMILSGFFMVFIQRQVEKPDFASSVREIEKTILREVASDKMMRNAVLENDNGTIISFVKERMPAGLNFTIAICKPEDTIQNCKGKSSTTLPREVEIYVEDIIISATLTEYKPKKLVLFVWVS